MQTSMPSCHSGTGVTIPQHPQDAGAKLSKLPVPDHASHKIGTCIGDEEMAQWVRALVEQAWGPEFKAQHPHKKARHTHL